MAGAIINIKLTSACGGGGHGTISVTVNGGAPRVFTRYVSDLDVALDDDRAVIVLDGLLRLAKIGRTNGQLAALLSGAGLNISVANT